MFGSLVLLVSRQKPVDAVVVVVVRNGRFGRSSVQDVPALVELLL